MIYASNRPKVGVGVYIVRDRKILLGLRKNAHGEGTWCPPGGHLEFGETWEECCRRETMEEAGIEIANIRFVTATNDVTPEWGTHYITLHFVAEWSSGEPDVCEPHKCERWEWFVWKEFPAPLFLPVRNFVAMGFNPVHLSRTCEISELAGSGSR
jgi:8-oxo-dGTP diphosphatase